MWCNEQDENMAATTLVIQRPDTDKGRKGLFIQEGRGTQQTMIKGRVDNDTQVRQERWENRGKK